MNVCMKETGSKLRMRTIEIALALVIVLSTEWVLAAESDPLPKKDLCGLIQEQTTEAWAARQQGISARDYRMQETEASYARMKRDDLTDAEKIARNFAAGFSVTFSFDQRFKTGQMAPESHGLIARETCSETNLYTRYVRELERYRER